MGYSLAGQMSCRCPHGVWPMKLGGVGCITFACASACSETTEKPPLLQIIKGEATL